MINLAELYTILGFEVTGHTLAGAPSLATSSRSITLVFDSSAHVSASFEVVASCIVETYKLYS